jgi:formyltetrahydrofolate-dependent phosphoribosylglycinamide formyltransferase
MSRIIILISGNGSNLQAVLDAAQDGSISGIEVALVVSNRAAAFGLERAKAAGIPTLYFPLKPYTDAGKGRQSYDADLAQKLLPYEPDLIVAAGWMHIFSTRFLDHFPDKVINLHPAPPGQHAGVDGIKRTFEAYRNGDATHGGCMVHWVVPELDAGPVIAQTIVRSAVVELGFFAEIRRSGGRRGFVYSPHLREKINPQLIRTNFNRLRFIPSNEV